LEVVGWWLPYQDTEIFNSLFYVMQERGTIADLEGANNIKGHHIGEAIQYRSLDREGWLG